MNKILGIVSEYNPFHNGHIVHLRQSIESTQSQFVIAVMSGNFIQRGDTAIVDKWTRAEMALRQGVDLVIELPTVYATSSAENNAQLPRTTIKLKILDPTTFPIANWLLPASDAVTETESSGSDVPIATIVIPITSAGT